MANNTLYGTGAGLSLTTGDYNTAVGASSLTTNLTGNNNVAVGAYALRNYTATGSTAVGYFALEKSTSGVRNTAVGQSAGAEISTGARNVFVGWAAGWGPSQLGSANDTIVIGYNVQSDADGQIVLGSGQQNHLKMFGISMARWNGTLHNLSLGGAGTSAAAWTGTYNLGIGEGVLAAATTAEGNVAVGQLAMPVLTTGARNVAIGSSAGASITTGSRNVFVGRQAGAVTSQLASVNDSIVIGHQAFSDAHGQIVLGTAAQQHLKMFGRSMAQYTTATNNLVIGGSGASSTTWTGTANFGAGQDVLASATTASGNCAVGIGALGALTTGNHNVAIGSSAGAQVTTGARNVIVGREAGASPSQLASVNDSIVIGHQAFSDTNGQIVIGTATQSRLSMFGRPMARFTTATNNLVLGAAGAEPATWTGTGNFGAGQDVFANATTASGNAAVGIAALQSLTQGSDNVAVGGSAGAQLTNGARNVFVGREAGAGSSQLATANDSIVIGHQASSDADGQVVLGTSAQSHLKMFGLSMARYTAATNNLVLGSEGSAPATWTGSANFGIGQKVFTNATTASSNCAVGLSALEKLTVGNGNAAVGVTAGQFWEGVYDSVAIGNLAGRYAVNGVGMAAVGYRSQEKAVTARNQSSLGDSAFWLSQGQGGVAVGYVAAEYVTGGDYSVYIGTHSGRNRADGDLNVFIGFQSGGFPDAVVDPDTGSGAVPAGDRCVGVGAATLKQTTGDGHTALGHEAGAALTSGSDCVFIGRGAGQDSLQKVDAVNSIAVGLGTYADKDNQVVLGNASITETLLRGVQRGTTFTVASLPSAAAVGAGARAFVTDADATSFYSVVVGSGTNGVPVFSDGTDWRIG